MQLHLLIFGKFFIEIEKILDGFPLGLFVGTLVGEVEGSSLEGPAVGFSDGKTDGTNVGRLEGISVVGEAEGIRDGAREG